ncbi:hypothetical protein RUM43_002359 [Polyplax serrata]|uniref:Uncharacterized protein n=1 Tax=Polyplax serrata TaxID=468196 RepID=A0AAN8NT88_POLSC
MESSEISQGEPEEQGRDIILKFLQTPTGVAGTCVSEQVWMGTWRTTDAIPVKRGEEEQEEEEEDGDLLSNTTGNNEKLLLCTDRYQDRSIGSAGVAVAVGQAPVGFPGTTSSQLEKNTPEEGCEVGVGRGLEASNRLMLNNLVPDRLLSSVPLKPPIEIDCL